MRYYMAPLEGVTTYVYRNAYHKYFAPVDKYFTPFLVPHEKRGFSKKELGEILPEHNQGLKLVPQIMSNDAAGFLKTVKKLEAFGYKEVNLNLGCPSKTVVSKCRGAGFLACPEELDRFLDEIYRRSEADISIKTRIGKDSPEEFERLLAIYNQYPVHELIIHPRVQRDFYTRGSLRTEAFAHAEQNSRSPLCYNGDIFTVRDYERICEKFPKVQVCMLGRGIIANPGLVEELKKWDAQKPQTADGNPGPDVKRLKAFHDKLLADYLEINFGDTNVLFKMKEIWCYMGALFPGGEKLLKKIKKAQKVRDYEETVGELFALLS